MDINEERDKEPNIRLATLCGRQMLHLFCACLWRNRPIQLIVSLAFFFVKAIFLSLFYSRENCRKLFPRFKKKKRSARPRNSNFLRPRALHRKKKNKIQEKLYRECLIQPVFFLCVVLCRWKLFAMDTGGVVG